MASCPISSWQIDGETVETVRDLFLGTPKSLQMVTTVMKLKDTCFLEEKIWPHREHNKKQRHYFDSKGLPSQIYILPVVIYGCESWTVKEAEHQRIDTFFFYEYMYLFNTYRLQNYVKVVYQTKRKKFTHTFIISLWKIKGRKYHYQLLRVKKKEKPKYSLVRKILQWLHFT